MTAMATTRLDVPDISCGHCKSSIEGAVAPLRGVSAVTVDVPSKQVRIEYDEAVASQETLIGAIEDQGYDVTRGSAL